MRWKYIPVIGVRMRRLASDANFECSRNFGKFGKLRHLGTSGPSKFTPRTKNWYPGLRRAPNFGLIVYIDTGKCLAKFRAAGTATILTTAILENAASRLPDHRTHLGIGHPFLPIGLAATLPPNWKADTQYQGNLSAHCRAASRPRPEHILDPLRWFVRPWVVFVKMAPLSPNKCHIPIAQRVSLIALLFSLTARSLLRCPLIASTPQLSQNLTIHPSLFTILTSHSLCTNTGYLTNSHRLYKYDVPQHHSARTLMVLLLSGDVESNPAPHPSMYPCGICELGVSVCCDNCDIWYHKSCISMNSQEYDRIETTDWNCFACN